MTYRSRGDAARSLGRGRHDRQPLSRWSTTLFTVLLLTACDRDRPSDPPPPLVTARLQAPQRTPGLSLDREVSFTAEGALSSTGIGIPGPSIPISIQHHQRMRWTFGQDTATLTYEQHETRYRIHDHRGQWRPEALLLETMTLAPDGLSRVNGESLTGIEPLPRIDALFFEAAGGLATSFDEGEWRSDTPLDLRSPLLALLETHVPSDILKDINLHACTARLTAIDDAQATFQLSISATARRGGARIILFLNGPLILNLTDGWPQSLNLSGAAKIRASKDLLSINGIIPITFFVAVRPH